MKKARRVAILVFFFASCILFSYANEVLASVELGSDDPIPPLWTKADSPYIIKTIIKANDPVVIEPGVVVKFKQNASATFNNSLTALGTEKEKIVFTAYTDDEHGGDTNGDLDSTKPKAGYWHLVRITDYALAHFENALFLYGGEHPYGTLSMQPRLKNSVVVKNCEFKHNKYAGINIDYNPDQTIENNIFRDNAEGIVLRDCTHGVSATISGNQFIDNLNFGAKVTYPNYNTIDARNNWWGDRSGPTHINNFGGKGDKISNGILFDPWIGKESNDPVIIIPGIMGSWKKDGEWRIDPIFHTYDNLYAEFVSEGYVPEKDLFTFPYEWRDSNKANAVELQAKIQEIKDKTHFPQVDIVAHSMGGLLAREYIESDYYENDVDQLITLGTPHLGAPKDYIKWEAGAFFSDIFEQAGKIFFQHEAKENNYDNIFRYIQGRPMLSVQELLPTYNYLFDDNGSSYVLRESYPVDYPRNEFLDNLNSATKVQLLRDTEFTKIIGNQNNNESTISGFKVVPGEDEILWKDGYPKYFNIPLLWRSGILFSDGDKTVPLYSAESASIPADRTITLESEHNQLPTDAQKDILEILTGKKPTSEVREWKIDDIILGMVFSPIDIQIISPSGQRLGKNFENGGTCDEIEGAYYTGYDTNTEFIAIPNPEDGEYKIVTKGTGEGEYKIEMSRIKEKKDDPQEVVESTVTLTGIAENGKVEEKIVEVSEDEVIFNPDTTPPTITGAVTTQPNANGWYNTDVVVHFEAADHESGIESVTPDITISSEGENQSATGTATDNAGNSASVNVSGINIDKNSPEIRIDSPENQNYLNDNYALDFSSAISDALSGIEEASIEKLLNGQPFEDEKLDLSLKNLGSYAYQARAKDKAGNSGSAAINFRATTNIDAIQNNINHFWSLNLIKSRYEKTYLVLRLDQIEELLKMLSLIEKMSVNPAMTKTITDSIKKIINSNISQLVSHLAHSTSQLIDPKTAELLIESLSTIKKD